MVGGKLSYVLLRRLFVNFIIFLLFALSAFADDLTPPNITVKSLFGELISFGEQETWTAYGTQDLIEWSRNGTHLIALRAALAAEADAPVLPVHSAPVRVSQTPGNQLFFRGFPRDHLERFSRNGICYKYVFLPELILGSRASKEAKKPIFFFMAKEYSPAAGSSEVIDPPRPEQVIAKVVEYRENLRNHGAQATIPRNLLPDLQASQQVSIVSEGGRKVESYRLLPRLLPVQVAAVFFDFQNHHRLIGAVQKELDCRRVGPSTFLVEYKTSLPKFLGIIPFNYTIPVLIRVNSHSLDSFIFHIESDETPLYNGFTGNLQIQLTEYGTLIHFTSLLIPKTRSYFSRFPVDYHSDVALFFVSRLGNVALEIERRHPEVWNLLTTALIERRL